jgi:hypothetical protein
LFLSRNPPPPHPEPRQRAGVRARVGLRPLTLESPPPFSPKKKFGNARDMHMSFLQHLSISLTITGFGTGFSVIVHPLRWRRWALRRASDRGLEGVFLDVGPFCFTTVR